MAAANDAEIVRIYTRENGGTIADQTFASNQNYEVVVEAEAGNAVFNAGGAYNIDVVVRNLTQSNIAANINLAGNYGDGSWPVQKLEHAFPIAAGTGAAQGDCLEALGSLRSGVADPDTSFSQSPFWIIHQP